MTGERKELMGNRIAILCGALIVALFTNPASAQDWSIVDSVSGPTTYTNAAPLGLLGVNVNLDISNFTAFDLVGLAITIVPNASETYLPGEFEALVFHTSGNAPNDVPPWVPPSIINLGTETWALSNNDQTLTFSFPLEPVGFGQLIQARFQIEWPNDVLFDILITPIIPAPGAFMGIVMGGFFVRKRRRRTA